MKETDEEKTEYPRLEKALRDLKASESTNEQLASHVKELIKQLSNLHEGANQRAQRLIDQYEIEKAKFEAALAEKEKELKGIEQERISWERLADNYHDEISSLRAELTSLREIAGKMGEALEILANPIAYLQNEAEKEGAQLDGHAAIQLSNDSNWLKGIAQKALLAVERK